MVNAPPLDGNEGLDYETYEEYAARVAERLSRPSLRPDRESSKQEGHETPEDVS